MRWIGRSMRSQRVEITWGWEQKREGAKAPVARNAVYDAVLEKYPTIETVRQAGDWSRPNGLRVTENLVTAIEISTAFISTGAKWPSQASTLCSLRST